MKFALMLVKQQRNPGPPPRRLMDAIDILCKRRSKAIQKKKKTGHPAPEPERSPPTAPEAPASESPRGPAYREPMGLQ